MGDADELYAELCSMRQGYGRLQHTCAKLKKEVLMYRTGMKTMDKTHAATLRVEREAHADKTVLIEAQLRASRESVAAHEVRAAALEARCSEVDRITQAACQSARDVGMLKKLNMILMKDIDALNELTKKQDARVRNLLAALAVMEHKLSAQDCVLVELQAIKKCE